MSSWSTILPILLIHLQLAVAGLVLDDFIGNFEPLFYDRGHLAEEHARHKRSLRLRDGPHADDIRFQFTAHNRLFKVRMRRDASIFAPDASLESTKGPILFDIQRFYSGRLEDDEETEVRGLVTDEGIFDGTVISRNEVYYIEPASRYFPSSDFHSVIYKEKDVRNPVGESPCASLRLHLRPPTSPSPSSHNATVTVIDEDHPQQEQESSLGVAVRTRGRRQAPPIRSNLLAHWLPNESHDRLRARARPTVVKRKKKKQPTDPKKITCMLYLQADHLFYQEMGDEEACIHAMTRHVQRVNSIYKVTDFDGDGEQDDINFMIKRIKVHTTEALQDPNYRYPGNYGVEKFLELFSEEDYDAFCLAYMFTYRDFEGGTLGLAWTGDLKNAGGVCEKNGHYRGSLKSLNTGIVTLLNYGKRVPPAVSHVTLAHEIGHNFGSPHDPELDRVCTPGGDDGNYIMFARATSGDKKNNHQFSPCSLKAINGVLTAKARGPKGCFTEPTASVCGNGVVEEGEECDCGWEEDCQEECCFPMRTAGSGSGDPNERPCTLRPFRVCSPSQGPCCTHDCQLKLRDACRDDNGCRDPAYCDGFRPTCPPSVNKPNKTICNEEFVCFKGECTGSICLAYGLESCQCKRGPLDPPTKACELCCKLPGHDQPCLSSFDWNVPPYDVPDMYAKAGTPCDDYSGYCDVFQKCREVDPSGPLATLRKLILSEESIATLRKWVQTHWYGVLFIVLGFASILGGIVKVFGKTPLVTLKKLTVYHHHRGTGNGSGVPPEVVVLGTGRHTVHAPVVRHRIPLGKKVRDRKKKKKTSPATTPGAAAVLQVKLRLKKERHGRKTKGTRRKGEEKVKEKAGERGKEKEEEKEEKEEKEKIRDKVEEEKEKEEEEKKEEKGKKMDEGERREGKGDKGKGKEKEVGNKEQKEKTRIRSRSLSPTKTGTGSLSPTKTGTGSLSPTKTGTKKHSHPPQASSASRGHRLHVHPHSQHAHYRRHPHGHRSHPRTRTQLPSTSRMKRSVSEVAPDHIAIDIEEPKKEEEKTITTPTKTMTTATKARTREGRPEEKKRKKKKKTVIRYDNTPMNREPYRRESSVPVELLQPDVACPSRSRLSLASLQDFPIASSDLDSLIHEDPEVKPGFFRPKRKKTEERKEVEEQKEEKDCTSSIEAPI